MSEHDAHLALVQAAARERRKASTVSERCTCERKWGFHDHDCPARPTYESNETEYYK